MPLSWEALTAIGTALAAVIACIAVVVAVWAGMKQASMARAQTSVDFVSALEDNWLSADGEQLRARAAKDILAGHGHESKNVYELLLRLERIGVLVETGALDAEVVWSELSSTILNYYPACRSIIDGYCTHNALAWRYLTLLHARLQRMERRRGGSEVDPSYKEWQRHLNGDIQLVDGESDRDSSVDSGGGAG